MLCDSLPHWGAPKYFVTIVRLIDILHQICQINLFEEKWEIAWFHRIQLSNAVDQMTFAL